MFVAMLSSITVIIFMEVATINRAIKNKAKKSIKCKKCKNTFNEDDANYCKIC
ncbi:MAG: hypothetical protein U9Q66_03785 [Patescibacteria group bacterium]|nr:hypothetical protein [Patescibacteria group bacterium]